MNDPPRVHRLPRRSPTRRSPARCWRLLSRPSLYPVFLMKVLCFALFACAFNLLLGYTGLLSFGHAMFSASRRLRHRPCRQGLGLDAGAGHAGRHAVAAPAGLLVGWLAIRRQGIYFAMITLALAQMVFFFCLQAPFTGGEDGLQGVPRGTCSA
jgi:branched-chain amino acid transport system permease protein